jgi:hypothetical protein
MQHVDKESLMAEESIGELCAFPVLADPALVVVGYAGRDEATVRSHITELEAIGIAPPPQVPMLYELDAALLTAAEAVAVHGPATSGEAEPVLVRAQGRWYFALGSDHTDRALEAADIIRSKTACPKPVSRLAIKLSVDPAQGELDAAWDTLLVSSDIDGVPYQESTLAALRVPSDLIARVRTVVNDDRDVVIFGGTFPLLTGEFRYGLVFGARMRTAQGIELRLRYTIHQEEKAHAEA